MITGAVVGVAGEVGVAVSVGVGVEACVAVGDGTVVGVLVRFTPMACKGIQLLRNRLTSSTLPRITIIFILDLHKLLK
jgi:hypothetical protein